MAVTDSAICRWQVSFHRKVRRVEVGQYVETLERTDCRCQLLHELVRLDFNMVQTIHRRELREFSGWWRNWDLGFGEYIRQQTHFSINMAVNIARVFIAYLFRVFFSLNIVLPDALEEESKKKMRIRSNCTDGFSWQFHQPFSFSQD
ncbi:Alpha-terpineol synthase [Nymphaea thermarum]|nr:Alpha-terpineol synthase [Nymphaea thermarum]